ncbi:MAG: CheR family methyltransferase, partial [Cyanobacteria bacterium P01_F01_bin.42]
LAMMLKEQLFDLNDWRIHLIATDINPHAIATAKAGIYREWSLRQIASRQRAQHFQPVERGWEVNSDLRRMVQWDVLNLHSPEAIARRIPWASMDLILCRNVFIYFSFDAIAQTLQQFRMSLAQEGYLLMGHAELEGQNLDGFLSLSHPGSVVYQRRA